MTFIDRLLGRRTRLADRVGLRAFMDAQAAFLIQKCLYEYSRAAAAYAWQALMEEKAFQEAMERARWQAYPLGMAMVAEAVSTHLRPHAGGADHALMAGLSEEAQAVFAAHIPSPLLAEAEWQTATATALTRLRQVSMAAPRAIRDIPKTVTDEMFVLIPVHERVRGNDPWLARNNLIASLIHIDTEFQRQADLRALALALSAPQTE